MALHPNGNAATLVRGRFQGGAGPLGFHVFGTLRDGARFNRYVGEQWSKTLGAAPGSGHYPPSAWVMPRTLGALSSSTGNRLTLTVASSPMQEGREISGTTTLTLTVGDAALQLLVLAEGSATLTLTVTDASLGAAVGIEGSTSATLTVDTPILGALAGLFSSVTCTVTPGGTLTATGALAGDILPYTELSPENLAAAVWNALASDFNTAGTMGEKLNDAGSAGNPWATEILPGFTAERMVNIIAAAVAGKVSGAPTAPVFRNLTDTQDQITGTADSSGNRTSATYGA